MLPGSPSTPGRRALEATPPGETHSLAACLADFCSHSATALEPAVRHIWPTPSSQRHSTGTYRRVSCAADALSTLIVGR